MVMLRNGFFCVEICENDMLRNGNSGLKMGVSRAAHTQYAYIWKYPPPPPHPRAIHDQFYINNEQLLFIHEYTVAVHGGFNYVFLIHFFHQNA